MTSPLQVIFSAGHIGSWTIDQIVPVLGETLATAPKLSIVEQDISKPEQAIWSLRGTTSNARYTSRLETNALAAKQAGLNRKEASRGVLIPIRKSAAWWSLAQDERREILEEQSRHIAIGIEYLPAVSRRLHHSRELGEPFDFLTWFEFAPENTDAFNAMLGRLRVTNEWRFVERELEIRVSR